MGCWWGSGDSDDAFAGEPRAYRLCASPHCPVGTGLPAKASGLSPPISESIRHRSQSLSNHIQQITAIAQRNSTEQGKITEDERLTLDRTPHAKIFQYLGDGLDPVDRSVVQHVQRGLGVEEERRHVVAIAGERFEAVFRVRGWLFVQTIKRQLVALGAPNNRRAYTPCH